MKKPNDKPHKLVIALTGGLGCGKSAALGMFKKLGAVVFDSDENVRVFYKHRQHVDAIINKCGDGILTPSGELEKRKLAKCIFENPSLKTWLEALIHPWVRRNREELIKRVKNGIVVCDIPLLYETHQEDLFDGVVVVSASMKTRLKRLKSRGMEMADIRRRMQHQMPMKEKISKADFVVTNDRSFKELNKNIKKIWAVFSAAKN